MNMNDTLIIMLITDTNGIIMYILDTEFSVRNKLMLTFRVFLKPYPVVYILCLPYLCTVFCIEYSSSAVCIESSAAVDGLVYLLQH